MNIIVTLARLPHHEFIDRNASKCYLRVIGHRSYHAYPSLDKISLPLDKDKDNIPPWIKTELAKAGEIFHLT